MILLLADSNTLKKQSFLICRGLLMALSALFLTQKCKVDEYIYDTYFFTVYSRYSDSYDHAERTWGSYQVELVISPDVSCK